MAYWLTRDVVDGELDSVLTVWCDRPRVREASEDQRYVTWLSCGDVREGFATLGVIRVADADREIGPGIPDDSRQCTRVESDPPWDWVFENHDEAADCPGRRQPRDTEPM